ncbi:rRNA maturation RNase YbeY [Aquimarina sp. MAR_2010_214]|uniref:rRNA maturation RNase YbeY n=1 Tax=Aquimarina sp. MAR_2010_214 TaxID=1250026 RepID=UPI000C6FCCDD|nr:rRNA maturation RNase YbeY [Aquimarina sp. MAR_2010_214]PKV48739.1 rRNA maturation RNase YbeY [Aquimarina sp. MAR_2010_214]
MINFFYETNIKLPNEASLSSWINAVILSENKSEGEINFILCDDKYLLKINQDFLDHDTLTDVISFDNTIGNQLNGDIFISAERVKDNANEFMVSEEEEMRRVLIHGVLHFCGYKDKSDIDEKLMRQKEEEKLLMFHVEH